MSMRNYKENSLKYGEKIPKEELYRIYIEENNDQIFTKNYFSVTRSKLQNDLKYWKIVKSKNQRKDVFKKAIMKKYGVENISQLDEIKEKKRNTFKKHYGVDCGLKSEEIKTKAKKTCLSLYGKEYASQTKSFQIKVKQTCKKKYGVDNYSKTIECKQKRKQTFLKNYKCDNPMQDSEIKEKVNKTNIRKYGVSRATKNNEIKQKIIKTNQEKYGVDHYNQLEESKEKIKKIVKRKYGYEYIGQIPEIKKKIKNTLKIKYNTSNIAEIIHNKMKINSTYIISKPEEKCYLLLKKLFTDVRRQEPYPNFLKYRADFYIPELNLYIEYSEFPSHGGHPFNENSEEDQKQLQEWKEKADKIRVENKKNKYDNFIYTWTKKDIMKRNIIKTLNLNYVEFFNMKEFLNWYAKL